MHASNLWTPWRLPYLRGEEPLPEGCLFCAKPEAQDEEAHIVCRGTRCYVTLNRFPYNNGHLMVVPYEHRPSIADLDTETLTELMTLTRRSLHVLDQAYSPQGYNVGINIGTTAGAGIAEHVHLHIVPRWGGDTNYITTVGETRLIPEWITQTYDRLRPLFDEADSTVP